MAPALSPAGTNVAPGIQDVSLDQIDLSDTYVHCLADFRDRAPHDELVEAIRKLEATVQPAVGQGADGDYFARLDAQQGLDYAHGYQRVYETFYGSFEPIRLEHVGSAYKVVGGYHRLFVARELGLSTIPAHIVNPKIP